MRLFKKMLLSLVVFVLVFSTNFNEIQTFAEKLASPKTTVIENDYIKVSVDNSTGRFGIRTVEGQPIRKNDQNVNMLFGGDDPETSFTTFRIDGTDYIFGNPYKFAANFFSEITEPKIVKNPDGSKHIETIWTIKGVKIKQIVTLYASTADVKNAGNVNVRYEVVNSSKSTVELGSRILLDTMVAGNDGPEFQIGSIYGQPLTVERKLVHDPVKELGVPAAEEAYYKLPPYWVMRDALDLSNPLATNVVAYGFNNFAEQNINIVDEMIVGHWNGLANTKWDYKLNKNLDFTRDTNDFGTADSAVAFYWNPAKLNAGASQTFETVYGLGELIEPDKVFSIRYIDPVQQLATVSDNSAYVDEGIFDVIAEVENLAMFDMEHTHIDMQLTLQNGLKFVKLDKEGNIERDKDGKPKTLSDQSQDIRFTKPATPEETSKGIVPKFKPGDTVTASFKVQASGKAWPTTREYMLTAKSPETQSKIEGIEDENIKAQYESSESNFVLLPPIGEAMPTYVYGMSPDELYSTDVKYIRLNLSNIEAYNTGNENVEPNFDLYLNEKRTGKRYKVRTKEDVIIQSNPDGIKGDMRITYRGGDLVDKNGKVIEANLGPELPLGEYQVEIDYKGDTGGDPESAGLFDIVTDQSFTVSNNQETRIREANILAVYKQKVDLWQPDREDLEIANSTFPSAPFSSLQELKEEITKLNNSKKLIGAESKALDPKFKIEEFTDEKNLEKYYLYHYKAFESQEEFDKFFEDDDRDLMVDIKGMIKQIGTGENQQFIVDTKTEPAIINDAVSYRGKDMVFVRNDLNLFGAAKTPLLETLFVRGDGILNIANSGFVFYKGEWSIDFFNGFNKLTNDEEGLECRENPTECEYDDLRIFPENDEDDSLNGSLKWAKGSITDRLSPINQVQIEQVYFNQHSMFAAPSFSIGGFGFKFNDYILRNGGISFGGALSMKVIESEIQNVVFNKKGFVGVDANLKFKLDSALGLFTPPKGSKGVDIGGEVDITHYVQPVGKTNRYGIDFKANIIDQIEIQAQLAFKQVRDGRVLPDVIAFGLKLPPPGIQVVPGVIDVSGLRGAVKELADTIAGGTSKDPFPLVLQAGITARVGVPGVYFYGDVDMTVKRTGLALAGKLDLSVDGGKNLIPILSEAMLQTQWVTPWFVRANAEVDVMGWDVVVGKAGLFIGQNLEKKRTDFEGYVGSRVQIPKAVPVVGGMPLSSVFLGVNNDKVWGSIGILLIELGITYYWGGGIEFGTSGENLPDGLIHMVIEDPEKGPQLMVIGQGLQTLATSWVTAEKENQEIVYREVSEGVSVIDTGSMDVGVGGITVSNGGRVHKIPMKQVSGNALIEVEYDQADVPNLTLTDHDGKSYPIKFDNTNTDPNANAFIQHIAASDEGNSEQVDIRKAYIIVKEDRIKGGSWTLTSDVAVESKLLNVPTLPELTEVEITDNNSLKDVFGDNKDKFTANWEVKNALEKDTVSLYLTEDSLSTGKKADTATLENGEEVLEPGEPGLLIAKDLPVDVNGGKDGNITTGSYEIDVKEIDLLGKEEDIRGLLSQGNYYLRAELKSESTYGTATSKDTFKLVNPNAPGEVSDVKIEPGGNGYFDLSFKPAKKKTEQEKHEHTYVIEAFKENENSGKLEAYPNYAEVMFTEEDLKSYWNEKSGRYEGIPIGGWTAMTTEETKVDPESLEGTTIDLKEKENDEKVSYVGLEVGHEYVIGVSSVITEKIEDNQRFHFAERIDSNSGKKMLLPIPVNPKLAAVVENQTFSEDAPFIEVLTNQKKQSINVSSDQENIEIEAIYGDEVIGEAKLKNNKDGGSSGTIEFDQFDLDGTFAIELVAKNTVTKDQSVTMLYLTVDTIAPILYIDEPVTGDRTKDGKVKVAGTTTNDVSNILVNDYPIPVKDDGTFNGLVEVNSNEPTIKLQFMAKDHAGNENTAAVKVTNDSFEVPAGIVIKEVPTLKPGEDIQLEAFLRVLDGKDGEGKPKFKDVPIPEKDLDHLQFTVSKGQAVSLDEVNHTITAVKGGASLIHAEYTVAEDITLETMAVANVKVPAPTELGIINAVTEQITGNTTKTKVKVGSSEDMVGHQFVYKVFASDEDVALPTFKQKVSDWSLLPKNGEITAKAGEIIVVAKRVSGTHEVISLSGKLTPNLWMSSGGGFPGFPGLPGLPGVPGVPGYPEAPLEVKVDDKVVDSELQGDVLVTNITSDSSTKFTNNLVISSLDSNVKSFQFKVDNSIREGAIKAKKNIVIDLPMAKMNITPEMLKQKQGNFEMKISVNNETNANAMNTIAKNINSTLLGAGQGVTIETNLYGDKSNRYIPTKIAIPSSIQARDITAIIQKGPDGSWTTIPWTMDIQGTNAFINAQVTGEGSISFIQNKQTFADVKDNYWGKQSISDAAAKLFVLGKGNKQFDPENKVTRAEYPTILLRVAGLMNKDAESNFSDVGEDAWFNRSVAIASEMGIVNGVSPTSYSPQATLSRIEGMTMVGRLFSTLELGEDLDDKEVDKILKSFKDEKSIPDWARKATALTIKQGIIVGENGKINSQNPLTRAQAAAIAIRVEKLVTDEK
ncbi:S-layer homology domain-containing protein [Cytobacillus sp. FJAT-53684]|uniref:S-layer homology domain-containing protein n=1 Tax=Cytobacillus mangrovibacter TaxID=3299024 RepID=A0ABW6K111_9BACI